MKHLNAKAQERLRDAITSHLAVGIATYYPDRPPMEEVCALIELYIDLNGDIFTYACALDVAVKEIRDAFA